MVLRAWWSGESDGGTGVPAAPTAAASGSDMMIGMRWGHRRLGSVVVVALCGACGDGPTGGDTTGTAGTTTGTAGTATGTGTAAITGDPATTTSGSADETASSGGTTAEETTGGPAQAWDHDLDGDGTPDTDLAIAPCTAGGGTCLVIDSVVVEPAEVLLSAALDECVGQVIGPHLRLLGDHGGDGLAEVAAVICARQGEDSPALVSVVDPATAVVTAFATAPLQHDNAFVAYPADPSGLLHPVLAPSYGDGEAPRGNWGQACAYRPDLAGDPACGEGFVSLSAAPGGPWFREVGGYVHDLDGDGWQDVTLIHHRLAHTISIATLAPVNVLEYDVAAATEPGSPQWFHSGRNYGTHAAITGSDGQLRTVIVGGVPVGGHADSLCNVSRFLAVLASSPGAPGTRQLAWSSYLGFHSSIFSAYDAMYEADPWAVMARPGDMLDGCIHRFSDSLTEVGTTESVMVNVFTQTAPIDMCVDEQYQLYIPPTWTQEKADAWYDCVAVNVASPGRWGMQVRRLTDGASVTGSQDTYVWGWSDAVHPGGERVYLVEVLPSSVRFDLVDAPVTAIMVWALPGDGLWSPRGQLPVAGRPMIASVPAEDHRGVGSYTGLAELVLEDRDGDGLEDVQLADGSWAGWSDDAGAYVVKP
jgi:hypothetical protein